MIFEGKPLGQITDAEISRLVSEHVRERQHLEFKLTVDLKDDDKRLEILKDIASLANGGGGYIIIGIRDDGNGMAQKFETELIPDAERLRKSIRDLCHDHIHERIIGLELQCRTVEENSIVIIRVPQSDRTPHMVSFKRRTDFVARYEDGKREMTYSEVRDSFLGDSVERRLASIEEAILDSRRASSESLDRERALAAVQNGALTSLLTLESGKTLSEAYRQRFSDYAGDRPFFSVSAVPERTSQEFLDLASSGFRSLLENPPGSRWAGWDLNFEHLPIERTQFGIARGRDDFRLIEVWRNGYLELRALVDADFCWGQSEEEFQRQPKFNPITISEYLVSFLRFYRALLDVANYSGGALLNLQYLHIKGFQIRPRTWYHDVSMPFQEESFILPDFPLRPGFVPDKVAHQILQRLFGAFGLGPEQIPGWNQESEGFEFEKLRSR